MDEAGQEVVRNGPYSKLPYGAGDLIRSSQQIVKVRFDHRFDSMLHRTFSESSLADIY